MDDITPQLSAVWQDDVFVRSYEVDDLGRLRLSSLFNYFQETAGRHATHLGGGYAVLQKLGLFWVLSRAKVRIHRMPAWGESALLTTWPKGLDGLLFLRDFQLTGGKGEPLVDCSTGWLLLDGKTYKPQPPGALPAKLPPNPRGHALQEPLRKLKPLDSVALEYERKVVASELDVNHHVNNARYVDWITDCYAPDLMASRSVRTMQVNYVGESTFGDLVRIYRGEDRLHGADYIEGINSATGGKVVQALIEWGEG
jgi:acyl-ACP thioesterase